MHKDYRFPKDKMYMPVQVGRTLKSLDLGITADNAGNNISNKNASFCELTAVYWAWKNLDADYIGLAHYRRHFVTGKAKDKWAAILSKKEAEILLAKTDILLPKKRNYYIESNYSHYIHAHLREGLDKAISIIEKDYPDYVPTLKKIMKRSWAHMFNIFVMKKDKFDAYCVWLFDILFKLEAQLDISSYSAFEKRVFGRVSELLLDVWIEKNGYSYTEISVKFMEKQNWIYKGALFLLRKFRGVKKNPSPQAKSEDSPQTSPEN
jgi:hypothetical protein